MGIEYTCGHIYYDYPWSHRERLKCDSKCPDCSRLGLLGLLLDSRGWLDHSDV
jgi:hypothetical protein